MCWIVIGQLYRKDEYYEVNKVGRNRGLDFSPPIGGA